MEDISGSRIDRYEIVQLLGQGGMATVYKAFDTRLKREVAIKLIRRSAFPAEILDQILARFEREAQSMARLSHPNIIKIHDYGEYEGSPYLVLEYMPGGDLKARLKGKPITWQDAIKLILPIAGALQVSHVQGIIHRDIKPSNIMFTASGEPMLSDFGIAKILQSDNGATLTGSGMVIGTPGYMAPEQWTGEASPQSDQYSLGVVLYEMLCGCRPYDADTPGGVLIKQTSQPLQPPSQFVPGIPANIEATLLKTLDKDPALRFEDMGAFIEALEGSEISTSVPVHRYEKPTLEIPQDSSTLVTMATGAPALSPRPKAEVTPQIVPPRPEEKRFLPWVWVAVGLGAIILVTLAVVFIPQTAAPLFITEATSTPERTASLPTFTQSLPALTPTLTFSLIPPSETPKPVLMPTKTLVPTPLPAEMTDDMGVTMRLIPAGEFVMGTSYKVTLGDFYIDKFEVTNALYRACQEASVCQPPQETRSRTRSLYYGNPQFDHSPVIYVDWSMAETYCEWRGARLPTEAEWEKAARGTDGREYAWGNGYTSPAEMCKNTNYFPCAGDTRPVGKYETGQSVYGVYDMTGNVAEWTHSIFMDYPYVATDGRENGSDTENRVIRGGSFLNQYFELMVYDRSHQSPDTIYDDLGFRCARDVQ